MEYSHRPVLFHETIESLDIRPDGIYIDATAGGGGHSRAIAEELTTGRLLAIDQDPDAVAVLHERLKGYPCVTICHCNFSEMKEAAEENGILSTDGVLFDLGVSSYQFDNPERGFSYQHDAPLDMRMSRQGTSAKDLVNTLPWQELMGIISRYGEDRNARSIAQGIVRAREKAPIETTFQLAEIIKASVPAYSGKWRTGQALGRTGCCIWAFKAGRTSGSYFLSVFGGPYSKTENGRLVSGVYLSTGFSGMCLRKKATGRAAVPRRCYAFGAGNQ